MCKVMRFYKLHKIVLVKIMAAVLMLNTKGTLSLHSEASVPHTCTHMDISVFFLASDT